MLSRKASVAFRVIFIGEILEVDLAGDVVDATLGEVEALVFLREVHSSLYEAHPVALPVGSVPCRVYKFADKLSET